MKLSTLELRQVQVQVQVMGGSKDPDEYILGRKLESLVEEVLRFRRLTQARLVVAFKDPVLKYLDECSPNPLNLSKALDVASLCALEIRVLVEEPNA
jgi:hypothetical protein